MTRESAAGVTQMRASAACKGLDEAQGDGQGEPGGWPLGRGQKEQGNCSSLSLAETVCAGDSGAGQGTRGAGQGTAAATQVIGRRPGQAAPIQDPLIEAGATTPGPGARRLLARAATPEAAGLAGPEGGGGSARAECGEGLAADRVGPAGVRVGPAQDESNGVREAVSYTPADRVGPAGVVRRAEPAHVAVREPSASAARPMLRCASAVRMQRGPCCGAGPVRAPSIAIACSRFEYSVERACSRFMYQTGNGVR